MAQDVYFTIRKQDAVWSVDGQLQTESMQDVLDIIMILMTNSVRVGLTTTDLNRSLKTFEKAMVSQLKDIIKAEAKEMRAQKQEHDERTNTTLQKDVTND